GKRRPAESNPLRWNSVAGHAAIRYIRETHDGKVIPRAIGGEHRNVRDAANAIVRNAVDARLPGRFRVTLTRPTDDSERRRFPACTPARPSAPARDHQKITLSCLLAAAESSRAIRRAITEKLRQ